MAALDDLNMHLARFVPSDPAAADGHGGCVFPGIQSSTHKPWSVFTSEEEIFRVNSWQAAEDDALSYFTSMTTPPGAGQRFCSAGRMTCSLDSST